MICKECKSKDVVTATDSKCPICGNPDIRIHHISKAIASGLGLSVAIIIVGLYLALTEAGIIQMIGLLMIAAIPILIWDLFRKEMFRYFSKNTKWYTNDKCLCNVTWSPGDVICRKCKSFIT